eukprot:TRINITY_DN81967_c0_g1_i1.p1 TRINITY_DN81967_c0_g1~~TRINITY_DN81967_c0_g1_i1.p1  ORF type:complete len:541 (-),score=59.36 TRINITY_DN81967_c0_g1_i1:14-1636(-)
MSERNGAEGRQYDDLEDDEDGVGCPMPATKATAGPVVQAYYTKVAMAVVGVAPFGAVYGVPMVASTPKVLLRLQMYCMFVMALAMLPAGLGQYFAVLARAAEADDEVVAERCRVRAKRAFVSMWTCAIAIVGTTAFDEAWSYWLHGAFQTVTTMAGLFYCLQQHFIDNSLGVLKSIKLLRSVFAFGLLLESLLLLAELLRSLAGGKRGGGIAEQLDVVWVCTWSTYVLLGFFVGGDAFAVDVELDATFSSPGGHGFSHSLPDAPCPRSIGARGEVLPGSVDADNGFTKNDRSEASALELLVVPRWFPTALHVLFLVTPWTTFSICYPMSYKLGRFKVDYLLSSAIDVGGPHRIGNFAIVVWAYQHVLVAAWRHAVILACLPRMPSLMEPSIPRRSRRALIMVCVGAFGYFGCATFETSFNRVFHVGSTCLMVLSKMVYGAQQVNLSLSLVPVVAPHDQVWWRNMLLFLVLGDVIGFFVLGRFLYLHNYMPLGFGELIAIGWESVWYTTWFKAQELFCHVDLRVLAHSARREHNDDGRHVT